MKLEIISHLKIKIFLNLSRAFGLAVKAPVKLAAPHIGIPGFKTPDPDLQLSSNPAPGRQW